MKVTPLFGVGIVVLLVAALVILFSSTQMQFNAKQNAANGHPSQGSIVLPGREGFLSAGALDEIPVFITVAALNQFNKAAAVKDKYGLAEALRAAYPAGRGTRVLVIGRAGLFGARQVRILTGPYAGRTGFVPLEWVREP